MNWLIIAALCCVDSTPAHLYRPQTQFDRVSCERTAAAINARWRNEEQHGIATCCSLDPADHRPCP